MLRSLSFVLLFALAGQVQAGLVSLKNGAVLPGELGGLDGKNVVWDAEVIGKVRIPLDAIVRMETTTSHPLVIGGAERAAGCGLGADAATVTFDCPGQPPISSAWSDVTEPAPPPKPPAPKGKITASMKFDRGNYRSDRIESTARTEWHSTHLRHSVDLDIDYESRREKKDKDEASLDYQADYGIRDGWYLYGRVAYDRDRLDTTQELLGGGLGLGRDWKVGRDLAVKLQGGLDYVHFDVQQFGRENRAAGALKWRLEKPFELPGTTLTIFHETELAWLLEEADNYHIEASAGIDLPIIYGIIAELRLNIDRTSAALPDLEEDDIEWLFSLGYKW